MRLLIPSVIASVAFGCADSRVVHEYLDDDSAAMITIAPDGWVFARERSDLAVHAQDYVTITPVQANRSGQRTVYLYCQIWSTIDWRRDKAIVPSNAELVLIADDRRITLPKGATDVRRLGFGHPPVGAPNRVAEIRVVAIDSDWLRFAARAEQVRIAVTADGTAEYFQTWRDGRIAAAKFLNHIGAQQ